MSEPQMVSVVEVCRVAPAPDLPSSASPKSLPLTFFDVLWTRFPPVERLFFYEISSANTPLFETIIPKLKHSLSLTLHHFLPLCGNLTWPQNSPKPILNYIDGDGVSLTIAESNMDFFHLSGNDFRDVVEYQSLTPNLEVSHEKASVMALQVTVFPNSGFCIGIANHHAIFDGKSSISFMKSWAHICKTDSQCLAPDLTPFFDRTVIKDPAGLDTIYANEWLKNGGHNNRSLMFWSFQAPLGAVRGTFELSREDTEKLRKSVVAELSKRGSSAVHVSAFSVICGYAWACRQKAKGISEKVAFVFSADYRPRLKPSIPPAYFGNCVVALFVAVEREELVGDNGVSVAAEAINRVVRGLDDGVMKGAENRASFINSDHTGLNVVGVAGSPRFEVYNLDFGWGRPRKVGISSIDKTGAISLADTKNGNGGVEIGLVLQKQEMETFASLFAKGVQAL